MRIREAVSARASGGRAGAPSGVHRLGSDAARPAWLAALIVGDATRSAEP
jgi:hypothetical protein